MIETNSYKVYYEILNSGNNALEEHHIYVGAGSHSDAETSVKNFVKKYISLRTTYLGSLHEKRGRRSTMETIPLAESTYKRTNHK